ncbi:hypothetical protein Tsubulata_040646 [Turnera subulata]|uniref:DNA N(6)-methyladenine demethylase n=1 Tax=Turnera subulata TaxID=218843 RepID=A0A9Q0GHD8_9ROSI|nr:hypothetical protein Tsubulata_040646 [Turnera subulata]
MNRGRGWSRGGGSGSRERPSNPPHRGILHDAVESSSSNGSFISRNGMSRGRGRSGPEVSRVWRVKQDTPPGYECPQKKSLEDAISRTNCVEREENVSHASFGDMKLPENTVHPNSMSHADSKLSSIRFGTLHTQLDCSTKQQRQGAEERSLGEVTSVLNPTLEVRDYHLQKEAQKPLESGANDGNSLAQDPDDTANNRDSGHPGLLPVVQPFDIYLPTRNGVKMLKPSLLAKNREKRNETKNAAGGLNGEVLRPGMVLLKKYLSMADQVKIVEACRSLGLGPGGFYHPAYSNGARLRLKMMCLGRNWDPETGKYEERRPFDGATPPIIPCEFRQLVEKAVKDSRALIEKHTKRSRGEDSIPLLSPNICIVNFYSKTGQLGLHQDKDESQESLRQGLPVVSFSIGDSAEFLYGDQRDVSKAEKVVLESGDVLIFGGRSRHIFHGVNSILPETAPKLLLDQTNLRPGRLNLTFREY